MQTYIVLFRSESFSSKVVEDPFGFCCEAEDTDHAEEQCVNAYPDANIVWIWEGGTLQGALDDFYQI
jgi:hypothetical protein